MMAAQVMTRDPLTVASDATIAEAARLMLDNRISGLPVLDNERQVVGILTEGDLLRRAETGTERQRSRWLELLLGPGRLAHDYIGANARKVGEIMTREIISVSPADTLETVVEKMEKHRIKRLPVIAGGKLQGIVSRADLVRALLDRLNEQAVASPASDADIRQAVVSIIDREPWGPRFSVDVVVEDGVVHLHGTVTDDRERRALIVAGENVPGVKAVRDHLVWVEPNTGLAIPADGERT